MGGWRECQRVVLLDTCLAALGLDMPQPRAYIRAVNAAAQRFQQHDLTRFLGKQARGLTDRIVNALRQAVPVEEIWLFGSCARGDAGPDSDVDLLVVLANNHGLARPTLECYRAIQRLHSGVPFDVVATTRTTWDRDSVDGFGPIGDAAREGIKLYANRREGSPALV